MSDVPKPEEPTPEQIEKREKVIRALTLSMFLNVTALCTPIQADVELFNTILYPGKVAEAAAAITASSSLAGGIEFVFNPTLGRLSDSTGRRPFFLLPSSLVCASTAILAATGGRNKNAVYVLSAVRKVMATWGGSVATMTLLGDVVGGKDYGISFARVFGAAGWGVIMGPLLGSAMLSRTKSIRSVYALSSVIALLQTVRNYSIIPETLKADKRKPFAGLVNPFAFLKLFGKSKELTKMVLAAVVPSFAEGKNLHDIQMLWLRNEVKLSTEAIGTFITAWGAVCLLGGMKLAPLLIKSLGTRGFTTLSNTTNTLNYALMSMLPSLSNPLLLLYPALMLLMPGINGTNSSATKGWAQAYAMKAGMGGGEYAGYFSNARALTTMLAPALYGRIYQDCQKRGVRPTAVWLVAAILGSIVPEALWRSIAAEKMPDAQPPAKRA